MKFNIKFLLNQLLQQLNKRVKGVYKGFGCHGVVLTFHIMKIFATLCLFATVACDGFEGSAITQRIKRETALAKLSSLMGISSDKLNSEFASSLEFSQG